MYNSTQREQESEQGELAWKAQRARGPFPPLTRRMALANSGKKKPRSSCQILIGKGDFLIEKNFLP